jgi:indole-3-glycerol phosphate synthase
MDDLLTKIVESRRQSVEAFKREMPECWLEYNRHHFTGNKFETKIRSKKFSVIAEIKRRSPSKGVLRAELDPARLASAYQSGGAAAVSVLTEDRYFKGSFADLVAVQKQVDLPVLGKDFIIDPYQLYMAAYYRVDAVLLICRILDRGSYQKLHRLALELGLLPLVEIYDQSELELALSAEVRAIAVNRRDLSSFAVDTRRSEQIIGQLPPSVIKVAASGMRSANDLAAAKQAGYDAALVGEALVTAEDPEKVLRSWLTELR